jgi:hypothetical protein
MFSEPQVKALSSKLSAKHVRTRQHSGLTLSYIEGWHTIAEANRIFGYDAWDRQTMAVKCVWEGMKGNRSACSYIARVRIRVRAGDVEICREGCGSGPPATPTISASPNLAPSDAKSVMIGLSLSAPHITVRCTALEMRRNGGKRGELMQLHTPFGFGGKHDTEALNGLAENWLTF